MEERFAQSVTREALVSTRGLGATALAASESAWRVGFDTLS